MIQVWDPLIRIFHWSLVVFFALAYFLEDASTNLHSYAGYTIALLLLFRLVWGFIGTEHARFENFPMSPASSLAYLQDMYRGTASRHLGHNPAGTLMVLVLLLSLVICVFTGISLLALEGSGPLAGTGVRDWSGGLLVKLHDLSATFTLVLAIIHILGVLLTSKRLGENLVAAMITGNKRHPDE
jgi:cytochrome b